MRPLLFLLSVFLLGAEPVVLDRVAVVVGRRVVKTSDIEMDLRASRFLNQQPLNFTPDEKKSAAERLIDQELIRQEILSGGYSKPTEQDVNAFVQQWKRDRFQGVDARWKASLSKYGLSEEQLRQYLLWQLTVLRFIDERFRPGVLVTDEEVKAYEQEHSAELKKANAQGGQEAQDAAVREVLIGQRVNQAFETWLGEARRRAKVEYREAAFSPQQKPTVGAAQ